MRACVCTQVDVCTCMCGMWMCRIIAENERESANLSGEEKEGRVVVEHPNREGYTHPLRLFTGQGGREGVR